MSRRTYFVEFGAGRSMFRQTEAVYTHAAYRPDPPGFDSAITFHKTYRAAKRKAGAFGEVEPVTEVKASAGKITHVRDAAGQWSEVE